MVTADQTPGPLSIVGIGGTTRPGSSSERALAVALDAAAAAGAQTVLLGAADLDLPMYAPGVTGRDARASRLVSALAESDGVVLASPGYHGVLSGLVKNALDYVEDLRDDPRPYLEGRAVGCIACAYGWQATGSTLASLRSVVHALRGWPTPFGAAVNSSVSPFAADGPIADPAVEEQLRLVGRQVVEFAQARRTSSAPTAPGAHPQTNDLRNA